MAVLTKHVLGIPSGKVGDSVAFTTWKGKACIRSLASSYSNPNTPEQQATRIKLALIAFTLTPLSDIINIGWKAYAKNGLKAMTALNAYTKYHLKNIDPAELFLGDFPDYYAINPAKLQLSNGSLGPCNSAQVSTNTVTVNYSSDQDETDLSYAILYNYDEQRAVYASTTVKEGQITISKPDGWDNAHLYIITTNAEGTKASPCFYYGTI